ncbi:hypothetical protein [Alistipes muris]|jgi:hypothetical protein|uniref:hypothetical protein n=1 Tax=Alistipes TaxID=239759 RepID=UPI00203E6936|nr:hypothetical protein [Alistipes muris]MCX4282552.1 hypothetical protein [Alistipes sp.]
MKCLKWIVAACLLVLLAPACSKDRDTNKVRFVIDSNTPETPIRVYGAHTGADYIVVKNHFENTIETDETLVILDARCDDSNTLITLEVHVNGKIKRRVTGNRWVTTGEVRLK